MFDIFYSGKKPGLFAHEREANSIEHAQELSRTRFFWWVDYLIDYNDWDWLWEPPPWQHNQRHAWPDQHQTDSGTYLVPKSGYSDTNYHTDKKLHRLPNLDYWVVPDWIDPDSIDQRWSPDPGDPPYIYMFPVEWGWNKVGGPEYRVPGATDYKHITDFVAKTRPDLTSWTQIHNCELPADLARWRPDPSEPPYIYVFGNQWYSAEIMPTLEYRVAGAKDKKYINELKALLPKQTGEPWQVIHCCNFDWSWVPDPGDPPYIYVFGNQWYSGEVMPTVEYHVPGATQRKFMPFPVGQLPPENNQHWQRLVDCEWDYSWIPDPGDPPYIYVFGNQWYPPEVMPTIEYHTPGAVEKKYMVHPVAKLLPCRDHWQIPNDIDIDSVDFSWTPDPGSPPYIYQFGTQHQKTGGPRYCVPGASEITYESRPRAKKISVDGYWTVPEGIDFEDFDWTWHPDETKPPYIYHFGTQHQKTGGPVYTVPGATEVTYESMIYAKKISIDPHWTVPNGAKVADFDWTWHPDDTEPPYIYQFATQHQKTGGPVYSVPGAIEVKYLENVKIKIDTGTVPIVEIDHFDGHAGQVPNAIKRIRYFDNYRDTLIRLAKSLVGQHEFVWICSSICDYSKFDFTWHPEKWQSTMLHVFASDDQKFGDTFYMHVPTFAERAEKKALLEWYAVNFVPRKSVPRRAMPIIVHNEDSHVGPVRNIDFAGPIATFTSHDYVKSNLATVSLWRSETKTIVPVSSGASTVVVPKAAVAAVKTQLYDYAYIDKTKKLLLDPPLDIVFISNGEPNAQSNYKSLLMSFGASPNRVHRIDNVNGRVAAYHAAAKVSTTAWFFAVFAKLEVNTNFDWAWQPDRMQQPKHYIFHARNPVNNLVYGHQAMIAYNRALVLANPGVGLDFTLDSPHEVIPTLSGTAYYNATAWMAWRTAFREVLKLKASLPDVENEYRICQWLAKPSSPNHQAVVNEDWSRWGAEDAVEYYDSVQGNFVELKKSYDWAWLASYAFMRRNLTTDQ